MIVTESPFKTELLGYPLERKVLRHNAYVAGWEHGSADFRPSVSWWDQMHALGLVEPYSEGQADGAKARELAWEKARALEEATEPDEVPQTSGLASGKDDPTALLSALDRIAGSRTNLEGAHEVEHLRGRLADLRSSSRPAGILAELLRDVLLLTPFSKNRSLYPLTDALKALVGQSVDYPKVDELRERLVLYGYTVRPPVPAPDEVTEAGELKTDGLDFDPQVGQPVSWREQPGTVLEVRGCSTYLISVAGESHVVDYVELSAPVNGPSEVTQTNELATTEGKDGDDV